MSRRSVGALRGATAGLVAAAAMCACGSTGPPLSGPGRLPVAGPSSTAEAAPSSTSSMPAAPPTTAAPAVPLGTSVNVTGPGGSLASVNATGVVDPASPAYSYDGAGPGQRFVAVELVIANTGGTALQENTLVDTSVGDSTGATQMPVVTAVAACSGFVGGEFALGPHSGPVNTCVTFELPAGSTVRVIHFSLGRDATGQGSWAVP